MELLTLIINGAKALIGAIYPPLKKKYFNQPKIYIKLDGNGSVFIPQHIGEDYFKFPERRLDPLQLVNCSWTKEIILYNNSEYTAYNLRIISKLNPQNFRIEKLVDPLLPLESNKQTSSILKINDSYQRRQSEASIGYKEGDIFKEINLVLEYTNVKGTKFYTRFYYSKDSNNQNEFLKRYNSR